MEFEVVRFDRAAQGLLRAESIRGLDQQPRVIDAELVAAEFLGVEQGRVRRPKQGRGVLPMFRKNRRSATHADREFSLVDIQRLAETSDQSRGLLLDLFERSRKREYQCELVATDSRDKPCFATYFPESLADLGQHAIAKLMP